MKLFEIVDEFRLLYDILTDETDPEVIAGTLESLNLELEEKAAGYTAVRAQIDMEAKKAAELEKKYGEIKKARENAKKALDERLLMAMDALGKKELPAGDFTIKIKKNGGQAPLVIDGDVPENMTKVIVEPDNAKIREYLKDNEAKWAHIGERGRHIEIK